LILKLHLPRALETNLPRGVSAQIRVKEGKTFLFLLNFNKASALVDLDAQGYKDAETQAPVPQILTLDPYDSKVLIRES
jgi:beta-galactosidase